MFILLNNLKSYNKYLISYYQLLLMELPPTETILGRTPIENDRRLLLTSWILANENDTFRSVAERFGVS